MLTSQHQDPCRIDGGLLVDKVRDKDITITYYANTICYVIMVA